MARLVIECPGDATREVALSASGALTLGRGSECDVVLPTRFVSRRHASIERVGEQFRINDLGGTNPLLVNGIPATGSRVLRSGDIIELGDARIEFWSDEVAPDATAVMPVRAGLKRVLLNVRHDDTSEPPLSGAALVTDCLNAAELGLLIGAGRHVLGVHRALTSEEAKRAGAIQMQVSEDGCVAILPNVTEAVRCALTLRERIALYNYEHPGLPILFRAGIDATMDDQVALRNELTLTAGALAARARALEVLVTDRAVEALGDNERMHLVSRGRVTPPKGAERAVWSVSRAPE